MHRECGEALGETSQRLAFWDDLSKAPPYELYAGYQQKARGRTSS